MTILSRGVANSRRRFRRNVASVNGQSNEAALALNHPDLARPLRSTREKICSCRRHVRDGKIKKVTQVKLLPNCKLPDCTEFFAVGASARKRWRQNREAVNEFLALIRPVKWLYSLLGQTVLRQKSVIPIRLLENKRRQSAPLDRQMAGR